MRYRIVMNIRHVGEVVDGEFRTHLKAMDNLTAYLKPWWNQPVRIADREEPMDWNDEVKVWYKLMDNLMKDTPLRAVPMDPPPSTLPPDAPRLGEQFYF